MNGIAPRFMAHIAAMAMIFAASACTGGLSVSANATSIPPATSKQPVTSAAPMTSNVLIIGMLSLKGPELGAWWALSDEHNVIWRLEPQNAEQIALLRQWQNRRIVIDGVRAGMWLNTPRVIIKRVKLAD